MRRRPYEMPGPMGGREYRGWQLLTGRDPLRDHEKGFV
jgi:hypothetical protein